MEVDGEFNPTDAEIADDEEEEPLMMLNAAHWDLFLAYVKEVQEPWAPPPKAYTDLYHKLRAVRLFNSANACAKSLTS
eukprot:5126074-Pleurochrysis_carterae.AAC.2